MPVGRNSGRPREGTKHLAAANPRIGTSFRILSQDFRQYLRNLEHRAIVDLVSGLKQMIRQSAATLLTTAAGAAHELYTRAYIQELERHSPFRFGFIRERRPYFYGSGGLVGRCVAAL